MKTHLKKILSAVLTIAMVLCFCTPLFGVFAAESELTKVEKWNLILGDEIAAKFRVSVSNAVASDAVMYVTDGYGTTQYALSEAQKDSNGNYVFTARLAAAQLADTITLQLHSGDQLGPVHSYSALEYAHILLESGYTESTKALVKALLNYSAAAQMYFDYNTDKLANAGYVNNDAVEIPQLDASNIVSGSVDGINFYGASLVFNSKVSVRFYFTVTGNIADYSFNVSNAPVFKDGMYYVEVANINPQNYADAVELTVNDALTVRYNPLMYISRQYYGSSNEKLSKLVAAMYQYYLTAVDYCNDSVRPFIGRETTTIYLPADATENIVFDYKLVTDGDMHVILRDSNWLSFYGDFEFNADGEVVDYDGITTQKMDNGYIHVTIRFAQLGRTGCLNNRDTAPASVGIFDIYEFGTADGYVDNIQLDVELPEEEVIRGEAFTGKTTKTIFLPANAVENLQFDYKLTTEGDIHVILRAPDWKGFYGDFEFNANGESVDYDGITTEKLEDGYIRVTVIFAQLGRTGCVNNRDSAPSSVGIFDVYEFGTADGYVDNIQLDVELPEEEEPTEPEVPTEPEIPAEPEETLAFVAGTGLTTSVKTAYESISFDYKLTTDGVMGVVLRGADAWLSFYGEYYFNAYGESIDYAGVTTEVLDNGYIHVTMYFDELSRSGCADNRNGAPANVGVLDIYGGFTTADGASANIQVDVPVEPTETIAFVAGTGVTTGTPTAYETVTFDYKLTSDGVMGVVLRGADAWLSFYGEFYFNIYGESIDYAGISTKVLSNGYIRVTMNLAELTRSGCMDNRDGAPANVGVLDIYGGFTTADGVIANIKTK